jgi:hypothetical protein
MEWCCIGTNVQGFLTYVIKKLNLGRYTKFKT